ncbi:MAG: flagellar biosynthetic protein FliO [Waddliaceae bacterium]
MKRCALLFFTCAGVLFIPPAFAQEKTSSEKSAAAPVEEKTKFSPAFERELKRAEEEGDSRFFEEFMNMLLYLGITVALIVVFMWILKRMLAGRVDQVNATSSIKILERRPLTQKTSIYILQIYGKVIAVADSINGITVLSDLPGSGENESVSRKP